MTVGYAAGLKRAVFFLLGPYGYAAGQVGSSLSNGSTSQGYAWDDIRSGVLAYEDGTALDINGGDQRATTFNFGGKRLGPFDVIVPSIDPALIALMSNSAVDTTANSEFELFSVNPQQLNPITGGFLFMQRFQDKELGADGPDKWHTILIPRCEISVKMGGMDYQAEAPVTIRVTPLLTTRLPHGVPFSATALALTDNKTDHASLITAYPLHITTFKGNGTLNTFTTAYKPISSVVTAGATKNWFAKNGTAEALFSVNTSTGVVVTTGSPAADTWNILLYQTNYVPV